MLEKAGLEFVDARGFVFNPLGWQWRISERDLSVNYVTTAVKPGG
jgi:2-polyprenyl-6-hydroxyphenyl methylase/3-demethylubiquinone-9 3-methyltransferase